MPCWASSPTQVRAEAKDSVPRSTCLSAKQCMAKWATFIISWSSEVGEGLGIVHATARAGSSTQSKHEQETCQQLWWWQVGMGCSSLHLGTYSRCSTPKHRQISTCFQDSTSGRCMSLLLGEAVLIPAAVLCTTMQETWQVPLWARTSSHEPSSTTCQSGWCCE